VHLKDNPHFMGQGRIDFPAIVDALADLQFKRWAVLETSARADTLEDDLRRNLGYTRDLVAARARA
jgi:L-ribulose-5-phosphate 3-epimerase